MNKEYEFRYKLDDNAEDSHIDSLEDFYKEQIKGLQDVVEFVYKDKVVDVDGFKFVKDDKIIYLRKNDK